MRDFSTPMQWNENKQIGFIFQESLRTQQHSFNTLLEMRPLVNMFVVSALSSLTSLGAMWGITLRANTFRTPSSTLVSSQPVPTPVTLTKLYSNTNHFSTRKIKSVNFRTIWLDLPLRLAPIRCRKSVWSRWESLDLQYLFQVLTQIQGQCEESYWGCTFYQFLLLHMYNLSAAVLL